MGLFLLGDGPSTDVVALRENQSQEGRIYCPVGQGIRISCMTFLNSIDFPNPFSGMCSTFKIKPGKQTSLLYFISMKWINSQFSSSPDIFLFAFEQDFVNVFQQSSYFVRTPFFCNS